MKRQFSSLGHLIAEGQWPLKDGEQTLEPCVCPSSLSRLGRAPRQALVQEGGTQAEPSSILELRTYYGSGETKSAGFCRASAREETIAQRNPEDWRKVMISSGM